MRALVLVALLAGCCPATLTLPDRYKPLDRIEDDASDPGAYHVFGPVVRGSVCDFEEQDQKAQEALLLHEQLIASRQLAYPGGVTAYLDRCARDRDFLCAQELDGWSVQIRYSVQNGVAIDRLALTHFLASRYWPPLDETAALYWIDAEIAKAK